MNRAYTPRIRRPDRCRPATRAVLDALAGLPTATPTVAELAEAMGTTPAELAPLLHSLESQDHVERWADRLMLGAATASALGLVYDRRAGRWVRVADWIPAKTAPFPEPTETRP